jgi:hypothetical protein
MNQSVKNGRGNDRVAKDFILLRETAVRGEDHGSFFITAGDKQKEKMYVVAINRDIADPINDQEFWLVVELQPLLDAVFSISSGKISDKGQGLSEIGTIAFGDSFYSQSNSKMSFSTPGGTRKTILSLVYKMIGG